MLSKRYESEVDRRTNNKLLYIKSPFCGIVRCGHEHVVL